MTTRATPPAGRSFPRRLGLFLFGVAIGLMVLGFFNANRQRAARPASASSAPQGADQGSATPAP